MQPVSSLMKTGTIQKDRAGLKSGVHFPIVYSIGASYVF